MRANAFAFSLLLIAVAAQAQSPAGASAQTTTQAYTLKQEVRNVVVDVIVTGKHGEAVQGLQKSQFHVFENGVEQDVAFFEEHSTPTEPAAPAKSTPALLEGEYTNESAAPKGGPLLVLLLDAMNTNSGQQSYVRAQIIDYLRHLQPGTHIAIFALGDRLRLLQGFTSDPSILKAALDGKTYPTTTTLSTGSLFSLNDSVNAVRASLEHFSNGSADLGQELRTRITIDALNAVAAYLADIPGRKNLVWFAGSVPWMINPDFSLVTGPLGRVDYSDDLKKLADTMTRGRISIYPVDSRALENPPEYSPDNVVTAGPQSADPDATQPMSGGAFDPGVGGKDPSTEQPKFHGAAAGPTGDTPVSSGTGLGTREMVSQMNLAGSHMSMSNLAAATGGRALYNTNGLAGAVAKVEAISEHYYTIAYSPKDKTYDGGLRRVQVNLGAPSVKLEYRRSYYATDPTKTRKGAQGASYTNPLRAAMKRGAPDSTEIPFHLLVREAAQQPDPARASDRIGNEGATLKGPVVRYDFHWSVDLAGVDFTPTANGLHHAEVDAVLDAYDADGKILNNIYAVLPIDLTDAQYDQVMKSGLRIKQTLDLPAGVVYMRAGLEDSKTGSTGSTEFPIDVRPNL